MRQDFILFAGTANPILAGAIADELGVQPGACAVERFPDGELSVRLDEPVRRRDVFIVQPTAPPVNDHLVELLAIADACRRSAAARITAVVPYFGYARSDKRHGRREPITASLVARLIYFQGQTLLGRRDPATEWPRRGAVENQGVKWTERGRLSRLVDDAVPAE